MSLWKHHRKWNKNKNCFRFIVDVRAEFNEIDEKVWASSGSGNFGLGEISQNFSDFICFTVEKWNIVITEKNSVIFPIILNATIQCDIVSHSRRQRLIADFISLRLPITIIILIFQNYTLSNVISRQTKRLQMKSCEHCWFLSNEKVQKFIDCHMRLSLFVKFRLPFECRSRRSHTSRVCHTEIPIKLIYLIRQQKHLFRADVDVLCRDWITKSEEQIYFRTWGQMLWNFATEIKD